MDLISQILNAGLDLLSSLVGFAASVVQKLGAAFGVQISPGASEVIGGAGVVLLIIYLLQWVFWGGGPRMFRPQAVVHLTNRTPFQIVMTDLTGCLTRLIIATVLLILVVLLFWRPGTPGAFQ